MSESGHTYHTRQNARFSSLNMALGCESHIVRADFQASKINTPCWNGSSAARPHEVHVNGFKAAKYLYSLTIRVGLKGDYTPSDISVLVLKDRVYHAYGADAQSNRNFSGAGWPS